MERGEAETFETYLRWLPAKLQKGAPGWLLEPLIYSNVYIALAAAASTAGTLSALGGNPLAPPVAVVFLSTLAVYNFDRVNGSPEDEFEKTGRHRWIESRRGPLLLLALLSGAGLLPLLPMLDPVHLLVLVPMGLVSACYCLPVLPCSTGAARLKEVPGIKALAVTAVWAGATALLPAAGATGSPLSAEALGLTLERAVFVFPLALAFDVRDLERDMEAGLETLAINLGVSGSRRVAIFISLLGGMAALLLHGPGRLGAVLAGTALLSALVLMWLEEGRGEMYFVGAVDGVILLQGGLLLLA